MKGWECTGGVGGGEGRTRGRLGSAFWQTNASIPGGSSTESLSFSLALAPTLLHPRPPPPPLRHSRPSSLSPLARARAFAPVDKDKLRCILRGPKSPRRSTPAPPPSTSCSFSPCSLSLSHPLSSSISLGR